MERNDGNGDIGGAANQGDAGEFSESGSGQPANTFDFSGNAGSGESQGTLRDRARDAAAGATERLSSAGSTMRDRAGAAKNRLADVLESGAERLRTQRAPDGGAFAGVTASGAATVETDARLSNVSERVAGGMQASADWLRDADLDGLKATVEQQVREHPGRTLLIAAGLGYLIGRALGNNNR